ncbi:MAG: response regulator [Pseudomonadota bacterium]
MESPLPDHLKKIRILLADDSEFIRRVVRHILAGLGFEHIKEVDSGSGVKDVLGTIPFGILISDVQMPGINGIELLRQIRCGQTSAPRDLPVVILTSFSNTEVLSASLALDVNGFLVKPMKPATVNAKIVQALSERILLRDIHTYQSVDTVLASLNESQVTSHSSGVSIARPLSKYDAQPGHAVEVRIYDLNPGMVLARDIFLTDGTLLLSAKHSIGRITINRLQEMREILKADTCWVVRAENLA